ncbi:CehA/McbA family metallohydrolase [Kibdelosporangium philippinense]|uniref:CehA/McbA family metallohydrolase n=1 Tax=Kibdelosporangium philippinense TaxID=211113 RepID=A0ABS8ZP53_9PSEU|nr:CehA/McbA family metallohydrolase [Kibdelosporangium philippinense]MCE7009362.1 CehA/McbA family metallohydrolase [Kibdelosporangium philippinense]
MSDDLRSTITGTFDPGAPDWHYLPVEIPAGAREIEVVYRYDKPEVPPGVKGNALDIGVFGPNEQFRGWSGGARDRFTINATEATPGYLPGPVEPGEWQIILAPYTVSELGMTFEVDVTVRFGPEGPAFEPNPAPKTAPQAERGRSWYRGDGHLHTIYSDGRRKPEELVADARAAGLDFIVSTEHNSPSAHLQWGNHATEDLLILNGEEVTTRTGHWPAWNLPAGKWIDWRYRADDPKQLQKFVDEVHNSGGLVVAAHPYGPCIGCTWEYGFERADLVEVWNGPWTLDDEATVIAWDGLLRAGRWIPAVGNSDSHTHTDRVGLPHNAVLADGLTGKQLMEGFAKGHNWIAESSSVQLEFTATADGTTVGIGETLKTDSGTPIAIEVKASGAPDTHVRILDHHGPQWGGYVPAEGATVTWTTQSRYSKWVRVEIRREEPTDTTRDTMVALTNPIFFR